MGFESVSIKSSTIIQLYRSLWIDLRLGTKEKFLNAR